MTGPTATGRRVFARDGMAIEKFTVMAADRIITYTAECYGAGWTVTDDATGVELAKNSAERREVIDACKQWTERDLP